ncbi:MAG: sensor histidine kinase [Firmicutes bacterium]|nr:sensor histidine kinase [Bacillota bacterium]
MKLISKLNLFFGIILIVLMISVFIFTDHFFQKELERQVEKSLQVTYQSFKITLDNIINEQVTRSLIQTKRDIIGLTTRDRLKAVLNYYLKLTAKDYHLGLIEILDPDGVLLADNNTAYEEIAVKVPFKKPPLSSSESYLSRRGEKVYLITTSPIIFNNQPVGYLNLGTLVDSELISYFSSVLNNSILLFIDHQIMGNIAPVPFSERIENFLAAIPNRTIFVPGNKLGIKNYDYIFFPLPSDASFKAIGGIARSRNEILEALFRQKFFLSALIGFSLIFGFIGVNLLARNIKKSIFGMEPKQIASLLEQNTTILQSTFEGIIALDQEGSITLINKQAQKILPTDIEMAGQPVETFFKGLNTKKVLETGEAIFNQQQVIGESIIVYNCVPIKTKNGILGAVITLRDLTEFQKVAEELVEVKNYTQALRSQAHEFLNKLQSLSGLIQLGKYETALALLHETTAAQQDLISFLANAFSTSAVSGILLGKYNRARELNIKFEINRSSRIPQKVKIPDNELVCIVGNLIENAFEALRASNQPSKEVWVKIFPKGGYLKIAVADNGPGIPPTIRKQIFERGFTTKQGNNKGIGLNLVRQSVEHLHGTIRFRSHKKTLFLVKIPLRKEGEQAG